jgi:hypothetical protein
MIVSRRKHCTCDLSIIGLNVIGNDHSFCFGRWLVFSVRLDADILLKRALLPSVCTDMKVCIGINRNISWSSFQFWMIVRIFTYFPDYKISAVVGT